MVIYLQREMSGDTCLCPASGAKPKLGGFKGGGLGNKYVQLNVGGSLYYTTVRALTRHDTMLKAMFSGRMEVLTDKEGEAWGPVGRGWSGGNSGPWGLLAARLSTGLWPMPKPDSFSFTQMLL